MRPRALLLAALAAALALSAGCAGQQAGRLRFVNRSPVWRVNDRLPIPRPAKLPDVPLRYVLDAYLLRRVPLALELRGSRRALNVNSIDEVPDSTWFTNRIGVRRMTVDEVRRGPNRLETPGRHRPWVVKGTKVGGEAPGFIIEDQRGVVYILKFDRPGIPEMETGADVVVQRLLHASGYNVPQDTFVYFGKGDLVLAPDAEVKDTLGNERPMTPADLAAELGRALVGPDGRIRALASKFIDGVPIGGYPMEGTRRDDRNDRVPHEHRRDVRGQLPIFAWLGHTDIKDANTLDAWVEDPAAPGIHYVVHYLLDFGKALGVGGYVTRSAHASFAHDWDLKYSLLTLPTLGIWVRPWEGLRDPGLRGVGSFDVEHYAPGQHASNLPYYPFYHADRFDGFWGAKILARFTPAQIRAVVEEGRYSDPVAVEYLVETLIARQRKTARHWFRLVAPLDRFVIRGRERPSLCFEDLALSLGIEAADGTTRYRAVAHDYDGRALAWERELGAGAGGKSCLERLALPEAHDGYVIVHVVRRRAGRSLPPIAVHVARDPATREPRVIGLRRY